MPNSRHFEPFNVVISKGILPARGRWLVGALETKSFLQSAEPIPGRHTWPETQLNASGMKGGKSGRFTFSTSRDLGTV